MGWGIENRRKKEGKSLWGIKKGVSLHRQKSERRSDGQIGLWCNGNTTDSGPVFPGSSPGSPTRKRKFKRTSFFG